MSPTKQVPARVQYVFALLLVYFSASAFMDQSYAAKIMGMAGLAVVLVFAYRGTPVASEGLAGAVLLLLVATVVFVPLHTNDPDLGPYFTIPLHLGIGFLACRILDPVTFRRAYINLLTCSAVISLALFLTIQANPSLIAIFPLRMIGDQFDYYDAGVHAFLVSHMAGIEGVPLQRNNGFAWEPGAYQVFLNLAVLLLVQRRAEGVVARCDALRLVALVAAVISTFSTGGYFALICILVCYMSTTMNILGARPASVGLFAVPAGLLLLVYLFASGDIRASFMSDKLSNEFGDGAERALSRVGFDRFEFVARDPQAIFGTGFTDWVETDVTLWNSILHTAITLGLPFTLVLLVLYWRYSLQFASPIAALAVLIVGFSTEALFWRMFFIFLAFSSIMHVRTSPDGILEEFKSRMLRR